MLQDCCLYIYLHFRIITRFTSCTPRDDNIMNTIYITLSFTNIYKLLHSMQRQLPSQMRNVYAKFVRCESKTSRGSINCSAER